MYGCVGVLAGSCRGGRMCVRFWRLGGGGTVLPDREVCVEELVRGGRSLMGTQAVRRLLEVSVERILHLVDR